MAKTLNWKQDAADWSWFATDDLGYFYRVSKVMLPDDSTLFACAWSETGGLRQSQFLYSDLERAKSRMDDLAAFCSEEAA